MLQTNELVQGCQHGSAVSSACWEIWQPTGLTKQCHTGARAGRIARYRADHPRRATTLSSKDGAELYVACGVQLQQFFAEVGCPLKLPVRKDSDAARAVDQAASSIDMRRNGRSASSS